MAFVATFEIEITPAEGLLPGTGRFDFTKRWSGDVEGVSTGLMMSAGTPVDGTAGYVALEVFDGVLAGRRGSVTFHQFGSMRGGVQDLRYEIVPGSGTGELAEVGGVLRLEIDDDGLHHVTFDLS